MTSSPTTDDDQDRRTVEQACGMLLAVKLNEPNWTGYAVAVQPILDWSHDHPSREPVTA